MPLSVCSFSVAIGAGLRLRVLDDNAGGLTRERFIRFALRTLLGIAAGSAVLFKASAGEVTNDLLSPTIHGRSRRRSRCTTTPCRPTRMRTGVSRIDWRSGDHARRRTRRVQWTDGAATRGSRRRSLGGPEHAQAARDALRRVDSVLAENSEPLRDTSPISRHSQRRCAQRRSCRAGSCRLEKMTGGGPANVPRSSMTAARAHFDCRQSASGLSTVLGSTRSSCRPRRDPVGRAAPRPDVPMRDGATTCPSFSIARVVQSFENANLLRSVRVRSTGSTADYHDLLCCDFRNSHPT